VLAKSTKVLVAALVLAVTSLTFVADASAAPRRPDTITRGRGQAAVRAQGWHGDNGLYKDRYGLGYTDSARHDPRDTNGN
jgi:hypothetical protein